MNWSAVVAALLGMGAYNWDFQRNELGIRSIVGTALLLFGGLAFTDAAPQFGPRLWVVLVIVAGVALFYMFAMTTIVRSRYSTPTIGREYLVGRRGVAASGFDPEGVVDLDGARWRARSHRAAGVSSGDPVVVLEVKGIVLEVGPVEAD
jgi:membrane-bound serine protease (ClpP class)